MKIQVVILLIVISVLAAQDSPQVYCGRRLARTLAALCYKDYFVKRSDNAVGTKKSAYYEDYGYEPGYISPWLAAKEAHGVNGSRNKRQVASECCDKACTIDELLSYC